MANAFKIGEQVQLKSGGPPMTIRHAPGEKGEYHHQPDQYFCEWFKGATRDNGNFHEHVLQSYQPPKK